MSFLYRLNLAEKLEKHLLRCLTNLAKIIIPISE